MVPSLALLSCESSVYVKETLIEKKNIENLIEIGLGAGDIIAGNHSANVNAFSALKKYSIQNEVVV